MKKRHPELVKAGLFDEESDYGGMVGEAVQELLDVFHKQGHSGFSAPHVAGIFNRIVRGELLTPLEDVPEEWGDSLGVDDTTKQNRRCSAVFKDENGAYYLDAIVWRTQKGGSWTGTADGISSRQYFSFPFFPKTFYIDVIEEEVAKDDWVFHIKDNSQLDKVWEYYNKPESDK